VASYSGDVKGFSLTEIGLLSAIYPTTWSISQLLTGRLSDLYSKKGLVILGHVVARFSHCRLHLGRGFLTHFASIGLLLGLGTAMVYPTFINAISDLTSPMQRAESLGVFPFLARLGRLRPWALLTGVLADWWGISGAIIAIGVLTIFSAIG